MAEKLAKSAVDYGYGHSHGERCGICQHFDAPDACEIVAGKVAAMGWCDRFVMRPKRRGEVLYDHARSRPSV